MPIYRAIHMDETTTDQEMLYQRADGTWGTALISASPVRNRDGKVIAGIVVLTDITERRESEQALRRSEKEKLEFYRRLIFASTNGKLIVMETGRIEETSGPVIASWEAMKPEDLMVIRGAVSELAIDEGMDELNVGRLVLCIGEATTNAIKHAHGGAACLHRQPGGLMLVLSDKGPGIAALSLPEVALRRGYSTAGTLGMGYKVMIQLAGKVYLATGTEGTSVGIEMGLHHSSEILLPNVGHDIFATNGGDT